MIKIQIMFKDETIKYYSAMSYFSCQIDKTDNNPIIFFDEICCPKSNGQTCFRLSEIICFTVKEN